MKHLYKAMKTLSKLYVLAIFSFFILSNQLFAQVLISATPGDPHESAYMEIRSEDGGLLIPNIVLEKSVTTDEAIAPSIPNPADGLLIFHDGTDGTGGSSELPKGLWYFDDDQGVSGKWFIYSRTGSVFSSSLDNFGEMYEINDMGSGTQMTLNNNFSIPCANSTMGFLGYGFTFNNNSSVNTEEVGVTAVADQLQIAVNTAKAYYTADISTTIITNTSGNIVTGQLFVNDTASQAIFFRHAFQTSGEYVNCSTSGIIVLESGDKVDFRFKTTTGVEIIYLEHLNVKLTKIGDY